MLLVELHLSEVRVALERFRSDPVGTMDSLVTGWRRQFGQALTRLMEAEIAIFLGEEARKRVENSRNGYTTRHFTIKGLGELEIRVPRDRKGRFETAILPARQRYDLRLQQEMALMYLGGMSTRTIELMSERLLGRHFSAQEVSEAVGSLHEEVARWRGRRLDDRRWKYLFLDGTTFNVRREDVGREPVLVAIGVDPEGLRSVLGFQAGDKESATSWEAFLADLVRRGLDPAGVELGLMDGLPGLERVFTSKFRKARTQRCQVHKSVNVLAKVPKRLQPAFIPMMNEVFYNDGDAASREAFTRLAKRFRSLCPDGVDCLEKDLDAVLAFYAFPKAEWPSLRSTNPIERLNKEFKRRTKSMEVIGGEKTCYAILAYISMRMEKTWRKAKLGTTNVVHLKPFQARLTQKT
jgi:putative transposase